MKRSLLFSSTVVIAAQSFSGSLALHADVLLPGRPSPLVQPAAPPKARPFSPHDVRLLDGPFKEGQDIAAQYLLSLEPDRFLANFRKEAGLEPKAEHYGGWESQGVSGHTGGHYLSACALAWAATRDARFLARVNSIVQELALCQNANGNGYVAAIPEGKRVYAEVATGNIRSAGFDLNGCWVPNYTLHKLFAGLRDAYRLCDNTQALTVARHLADWMESVHADLTEAQMQQILACEHGGLETHVRYADAIYFADDAGLWVNLYLASELTWKARGVTLRQETRWPDGDSTTLRISCREPQSFILRLRRPHWAQDGFSVSVNGEPHAAELTSSGYARIQRTWKPGDRVDVRFPMTLRTESMPDNPKRIAVFYGPTLLAANLGTVDDPAADRSDYVPMLLTEERPVAEWIKITDLASLQFRTHGVGKPRDVDLVPFHRLHDRRYTVYLDVFTQTDWEARHSHDRHPSHR